MALIDYLIPPICEGCDSLLGRNEKRLCASCLIDMQPLKQEGRCLRCFQLKERPCQCHEPSFPFNRLAVLWDYKGAPKQLIKQYKRAHKEFDTPLFSHYLLMQLEELEWPKPDLIAVPPQDPLKRLWKRFHPIGEIAHTIASFLSIPVFKGLRKRGGRPSQGTLNKEERASLPADQFILVDRQVLRGQRILLIDDVLTTGATLKSVAHCLWGGSPLSIYGLALAWVEPECY